MPLPPSPRRRRAPPWSSRAAARGLALAAALFFCGDEAAAHDFWIEPSTFHPPQGTILAVGLRVGQNFIGDPVPRVSSAIEEFFIRQADGEHPIEGADDIDPAGFVRADGEATSVIAYRSAGSYVELPPAKFEDYLRLYGLEEIIEERARRGEGDEPGRERFYRYAKALLTGITSTAAAAEPLPFEYEIVPDEDPTRRFGGFRGRLLYRGEPLANAQVEALLYGDPSVVLSARSDADGKFSFDLPRGGVWLIKSVHMVRAGFFSDADWESLWASLTFDMPEAQP